MIITVKQVASLRPCGFDCNDDGVNYTFGRLRLLFEQYGDGERMTVDQVLAIPRDVVPAKDLVWLLLRVGFLTCEQLHLLTCDFAESVVHLCDDNYALDEMIAAKRAWAQGGIDDHELLARWNVINTSVPCRTSCDACDINTTCIAISAIIYATEVVDDGAAAEVAYSTAYAANRAITYADRAGSRDNDGIIAHATQSSVYEKQLAQIVTAIKEKS